MRLRVLHVLCSSLQIIALFSLIALTTISQLAHREPTFARVLIGIGGFAAIVRYFLPALEPRGDWMTEFDMRLRPFAAIAGFLAIIFVCAS